MAPLPVSQPFKSIDIRNPAIYVLELLVVGGIYFALAKLDLVLSATHLSSIPISAAPGFALAAVLLRGLCIWPAVFVGALAAGAPVVITDYSKG